MEYEQHISEEPGRAVVEVPVPEPGRAWKAARWAEFIALFVVGPAVMAAYLRSGLLFPAMWIMAAGSLILLLPDRSFERRRLWNTKGLRLVLPGMLVRFAVCAALLAGVLAVFEPARLLQLPRHNPGLWAIIMFAYPVFSVFPQEIAFRAFFFHRYEKLVARETVLIAVSAVAFGYAHIIMHNWWSVAFSTIGGGVLRGDVPALGVAAGGGARARAVRVLPVHDRVGVVLLRGGGGVAGRGGGGEVAGMRERDGGWKRRGGSAAMTELRRESRGSTGMKRARGDKTGPSR